MTTKKHWTAEELSNKVVANKPMSDAELKKVHNELIKSRVQIMFDYSFFGYLIMHLQLEPDYTIDTAATDGKIFYYNPYFIKALSMPERSWIIVHEVMHAALKHLWRCGTRIPEKWNYACDYAIHSIMQQFLASSDSRRNASLRMPRNCLYSSKYDDMSAEQIYASLPDNYKESASFGSAGGSSSSSGDNSNNKDGNGGKSQQTPLDDHSKWYTAQQQSEATINQRTWDGRLVAAAQIASAKNAGHLPAFLKRLIDKITRARLPWRLLLHNFIDYEINDFSFTKCDNRYTEEEWGDIKMPSFSDEQEVVKNLVIWIDTSGSISHKELTIAYSEIIGAMQQFSKLKAKVGFFDAMAYPLHDVEEVNDVLALKPEGGGGTDVNPCFEYISKNLNEDEVVGIIFITDGYFHWYDESIANGIPTLWIINNEQQEAKWGISAVLDVSEYED